MRSGRLRWRRVLGVLAVLCLLCLIAFVYQAWRAGSALISARDAGTTLTRQLNAGDLAGAAQTVDRLRADTARAHHNTDGPLWVVGAHVPFIGKNFRAVSSAGEALDRIAANSLPTLLSLARQVDSGSLRPRHGRLDLAAVRRLAPSVQAAAANVDGPAGDLLAIRPGGLIYPLSDLMSSIRSQVTDARNAIDATADAFDVLPGMLGADGPKTYLLLVQNPAEVRSTGGLPGSWAVLHARNGKVTMGFQGDASSFRTGRLPVRLTAQEKALYGDQLGLDPRDISFDPDFPRVAQMAAALAQAKGVHVDGVFAVDPIALAQVLQGTGPVVVPPGVTINAADATQVLLNGIYRNVPDPVQQNNFFSAAARAVFNALVAGKGDQVRAIRGLVQAAGQWRVLAWSPDPKVAAKIGANALSGALPRGGTAPQIGLFLNDGVAGKIEYYLRHTSAVTATSCSSAGVQQLALSTTFRSVAPPSVSSLPVWVTGDGTYAPRGNILMNLRIYAPTGGSIESLAMDGHPLTITDNMHDGHQVGLVPISLPPGASVTVTGVLASGPRQRDDVRVTSTPGMELTRDPMTFASACS